MQIVDARRIALIFQAWCNGRKVQLPSEGELRIAAQYLLANADTDNKNARIVASYIQDSSLDLESPFANSLVALADSQFAQGQVFYHVITNNGMPRSLTRRALVGSFVVVGLLFSYWLAALFYGKGWALCRSGTMLLSHSGYFLLSVCVFAIIAIVMLDVANHFEKIRSEKEYGVLFCVALTVLFLSFMSLLFSQPCVRA